MTTYRERRLARAERLRGWAETRTSRATEALNSQPELRHDWAFITQPGRIPERDRMNRSDERAFRSLEKAEGMASRADEIERQASHAIYSGDPDAAERLRERIAGMEADRETRKAANAAYRKAHRVELSAMTPYQRDQAVPWPSYSISNLGGNIARLKARLHNIEHPPRTTFAASRRDPEVCWRDQLDRAGHAPYPGYPDILVCPPKGA